MELSLVPGLLSSISCYNNYKARLTWPSFPRPARNYSSDMSCPRCFSGHVNPGTPLGNIEQVYGRRTYVAKPPSGKQTLGILVIIPDAFGLPFVNNQILADHYASLGQYTVYLPDFMDGETHDLHSCDAASLVWLTMLQRQSSSSQNDV